MDVAGWLDVGVSEYSLWIASMFPKKDQWKSWTEREAGEDRLAF